MTMNRILRTVLMVTLSMALAAGIWGIGPAQRTMAAEAITTYDYVPKYIPDDLTPIAVRVTFSDLVVGECYVYKVRLYKATTYYGQTWNTTTSTWVASGSSYTNQNQFIAPATSQSFWIYVRNTTLTYSETANDVRLAIVASSNGTSLCNSAPTFSNGTPAEVTMMKMTTGEAPAQFGGWLEETTGTARAERAILVKDGTDIVGLYVAEDNTINEGYTSDAGYYKVGVPSCINCEYTIETWDLNDPGTSVGQTNVMGSSSCPADVNVGETTSLNSCTTPTAVNLSGLSATSTSPFAALAVGLLAATGLVVLRKRK